MEVRLMKRDPRIIDLTGERFGRLLVLGLDDNPGRKEVHWSCLCDCGTTKSVSRSNLRSGSTVSCGCYRSETNPDSPSNHPLYLTWYQMIDRCHDPKCKRFHRYGGRGIKVCQRWRDSFRDFCEDVGEKPGPEYTVDRYPDPDGDYEPGNFRWATVTQQNRNRSHHIRIEYRGETRCLSEWAEHLGLDYMLLFSRIKNGWDAELAFSTPPGTLRRFWKMNT
jgi:hypothetical protein